MKEEYADVIPILFGGDKITYLKTGIDITDPSWLPTPEILTNYNNGIYTILNKITHNPNNLQSNLEVEFKCGDTTLFFSLKENGCFCYKKVASSMKWTCVIAPGQHSRWLNDDFEGLYGYGLSLTSKYVEIVNVFYKTGYLKGVLAQAQDDIFVEIDGRSYNFLINISSKYVLTRFKGVKNGFSDPKMAELYSRLANSRCFNNSITLTEKDFKRINLISIKEEVKEADLVRKSYYFIDIDEGNPVIGRFFGFRSDGKPMFYTGGNSIWIKNDNWLVKFYNIEENDQV